MVIGMESFRDRGFGQRKYCRIFGCCIGRDTSISSIGFAF